MTEPNRRATSLTLDRKTRAGIARIVKESPTPSGRSGAIRGIVAKYIGLLDSQLIEEERGSRLWLVSSVSAPERGLIGQLDLRL